MTTTVRLTKPDGSSIAVSVTKFISGGNWIQLKHWSAFVIYTANMSYFSSWKTMGNGETQLTLKEGINLTIA